MKKRVTLLLIVLALLSSCAFFQNQKANWEACASDPTCLEQAKSWQAKGGTAGSIVGGTAGSFIPGAAGVGTQVGKYAGEYIALAFAMLLGGAAIRKKQQPQ